MTDRIAIKRLTASDCTLFEAVFRRIDAGNQKSINLNADILTGRLYPDLASIAARSDNEIAIAVTIHGPGAKGPHKVARKIVKGSTYKNWRLNGEFIPGPPDDPSRYDDLGPGDLAVMLFRGEAGPRSMDLIIVSRSDAADLAAHNALSDLFGNRSMIAVTSGQIRDVLDVNHVPDSHPARLATTDPAMDSALEDAAQGGLSGINRILRNRTGRTVSSNELAKAKAAAEIIGHDGEGLVNGHLIKLMATGRISTVNWVSSRNAVAPYDFELSYEEGERTLIDVKTTSGPFDNPIHLSLAEIIEAAGPTLYRIYRVYDLSEDGGKLRVSRGIGHLARNIKKIHEEHLPSGFRVDSFSVAASALEWGPEKIIARGGDDEDDL